MFCVICQRDVYDCICPDINERLAAIASHPNFAVAWCTDCDKALDRCDCADVGQEKKSAFRTGRDWLRRFTGF